MDERLLVVIAGIGGQEPIRIVAFGSPGPDASPALPLLWADFAEAAHGSGTVNSRYVRSMLAFLGRETGVFAPARDQAIIADGGVNVLRVEFSAPPQLGLLGPQSSR